jgi:DHA2 family multidrug resistance protein-like MFS transporter
LWIADVYGFILAAFLVTMTTLGARVGRPKLLMIGAAGFGVASLMAAYSVNPGMLIAARTLMGIAGATPEPCTLASIAVVFESPKQRAAAFGLWE